MNSPMKLFQDIYCLLVHHRNVTMKFSMGSPEKISATNDLPSPLPTMVNLIPSMTKLWMLQLFSGLQNVNWYPRPSRPHLMHLLPRWLWHWISQELSKKSIDKSTWMWLFSWTKWVNSSWRLSNGLCATELSPPIPYVQDYLFCRHCFTVFALQLPPLKA